MKTFPGWRLVFSTPAIQRLARAAALLLIAATLASTGRADDGATTARRMRFATFNVSLTGNGPGELISRLEGGDDSQARAVAEIIQRVAPDVLLLNEFDFDPQGKALHLFLTHYLGVGQNSTGSDKGTAEPIRYGHHFIAPSNTGSHSGFDLDRDGTIDDTPGDDAYARDALGYGRFAGHYAMAVLSKFPIQRDSVRTFRTFLWKDMPGALLPDDPKTQQPSDWYSAGALAVLPLSSKSHWDVPLRIGETTVHLLASHPTPPVFDGPEDRNGRRNHDEIRFWVDYVVPPNATYIYDDSGRRGGLVRGAAFVLLGDLNSDPHDGDDPQPAIRQLLEHPSVQTAPTPASAGAAEQAALQGGANDTHRGDPRFDTLDAADDPGPGNLRLDYVLPSRNFRVTASGVFWPRQSEPLFSLVGTFPYPSSDHRLVWLDVERDIDKSKAIVPE